MFWPTVILITTTLGRHGLILQRAIRTRDPSRIKASIFWLGLIIIVSAGQLWLVYSFKH